MKRGFPHNYQGEVIDSMKGRNWASFIFVSWDKKQPSILRGENPEIRKTLVSISKRDKFHDAKES